MHALRFTRFRLTRFRFVVAALALISADPAAAAVHVSGSVKTGTFSGGWSSYDTRGGSMGIGVDLGRYIRLNLTHEQSIKEQSGFEDPDDEDTEDPQNPRPVYSRQHIYANSVDLQVVLYEGESFVPYLLGGIVQQLYVTDTLEKDGTITKDRAPGFGPTAGLGVGIPLNKDFMLKLQYTLSPGTVKEPDNREGSKVINKSSSVILSYKI